MTSPPVIVLATSNLHKVQEMRALLSGAAVTLLGLGDVPALAGRSVAETGHTFAENARQKALGYGAFHDHYTLAEDSGLCVDALGGAPGVFSARFGEEQGGPPLTDAGRNTLLLERLAGQKNRRANYHCAMCLVKDGCVVAEVCGEVFGEIATACRGEGGFGYDPLFIPEGYGKTFGELPVAVKGAISHRAVASRTLVRSLQGLVA